MIQDEFIAIENEMNKKWQIYRSYLRLFRFGSEEITLDSVNKAHNNYYDAAKAYQLARKEMGMTYILENQ